MAGDEGIHPLPHGDGYMILVKRRGQRSVCLVGGVTFVAVAAVLLFPFEGYRLLKTQDSRLTVSLLVIVAGQGLFSGIFALSAVRVLTGMSRALRQLVDGEGR